MNLYDADGNLVSCITERTNDEDLAVWQCSMCKLSVEAWRTVCKGENCTGTNPCVVRTHSNTKQMEDMKKKIAENKPLIWYEKEAATAYREAFAKSEASETLQQHFRNNQNPKVVAEMRVRGAWETASGGRGNSTPAANIVAA